MLNARVLSSSGRGRGWGSWEPAFFFLPWGVGLGEGKGLEAWILFLFRVGSRVGAARNPDTWVLPLLRKGRAGRGVGAWVLP